MENQTHTKSNNFIVYFNALIKGTNLSSHTHKTHICLTVTADLNLTNIFPKPTQFFYIMLPNILRIYASAESHLAFQLSPT